MRVHYLQHVPFEGLGAIEQWLIARSCDITSTRLFEPSQLPSPEDFDLLIIMGGPMSVNDEAEYPWLTDEKSLVRRAIASGKAVLGVCLGAQLIASAMGASVRKNRCKEIGWFPIEEVTLTSSDDSAFRLPPSANVFHWHGETFDLPHGAIHLARSRACEHQAFQVGCSVLGLQFHLEATPESVASMIRHAGNELEPSEFVQSAIEILSATPEQYAEIHRLMAAALLFLSERV